MPEASRHLWGESPRAWLALLACVLTLSLAAGARLSFSAYLLPIERDTGLDRLTLSLALAMSAFAYGAVLPLTGRLATRYGSRPVLMAGVLLMAIAGIGVVTARAAWQIYLFVGVLPGLGFGAAGHVPGAVLLSRWFTTRLGLAVGIMVSAIPAGQAVSVPLSALLIERIGWRPTYLLTGALLAGIAVPALWHWARLPASGTPDEHPRPSIAPRTGRDEVILGAGYFACGLTDQFVAFHLVALVTDAGATPLAASAMLSVSLLAGLGGSLLSGPVADRVPARVILSSLYLARAAVLPLLLVSPDDMRALTLFALVFGTTYIANQAPSTRFVRDRHGATAVGPIMGNIALAHQVGAAVGIAAGGASVHWLGGYGAAVMATTVVALAGSVTQLALPSSPPSKA